MYSPGVGSTLGFPYDYGSIMHYRRSSFSKNGLDTITPKDPRANIGQRRGLSKIDIAQLKTMYNCGAPTSAPATVAPITAIISRYSFVFMQEPN